MQIDLKFEFSFLSIYEHNKTKNLFMALKDIRSYMKKEKNAEHSN